MKSVIITGTDTDIGKTFISAMLMAGLQQYRYWKPIQSGLEGETDSVAVERLSGLSRDRILPEKYVFAAPLSPHAAARLEGRTIDEKELIPLPKGPLIIEGAGGALVPLNDETLYADVFRRWQLPAIVVTRSTLGTINHTLLTVEALRSRGVEVIGCIMNGPANSSNHDAIEHYGRIEVLGTVNRIEMPAALSTLFSERLHRVEEVLQ